MSPLDEGFRRRTNAVFDIWQPTPEHKAIVNLPATVTSGTNFFVWTAKVDVPGNAPGPLRVTFHEYEQQNADNADHSGLAKANRLVYSESIPVVH